MQSLQDKVAVVAGATRGAGRGIAAMLGEAGATVYVTGRSVAGDPSPMRRPETIEQTAEFVNDLGGIGIPVRVDHTDELDVRRLFERVKEEQGGRLEVLINDVWGGDPLTEWDSPFWDQDVNLGWQIQRQAVYSHVITSRYGVPLMLARNEGRVIEVTDGVDYRGPYEYYSDDGRQTCPQHRANARYGQDLPWICLLRRCRVCSGSYSFGEIVAAVHLNVLLEITRINNSFERDAAPRFLTTIRNQVAR